MSLDEAIERSSLRAEAVRRIRAAIIYGEIAPGEIHSAPALAARMGVSVTPVREALLELTNRGMVDPGPQPRLPRGRAHARRTSTPRWSCAASSRSRC